jgi:hypothetical protein
MGAGQAVGDAVGVGVDGVGVDGVPPLSLSWSWCRPGPYLGERDRGSPAPRPGRAASRLGSP